MTGSGVVRDPRKDAEMPLENGETGPVTVREHLCSRCPYCGPSPREFSVPEAVDPTTAATAAPASGTEPFEPYYSDDFATIYHGDCRDFLPGLASVDSVVTDPPYGVRLEAKRAKQRGGDITTRAGRYSFDDTPEYIGRVVVPVIETCRELANAVAVTPGTRNLWLYPPADEVGCFYSAAGTGMGKWGFSCSQPILYYGSDPYLRTSQGARANSCGQTYPNDANGQNHPCAKPVRMMRWLVQRASLPGEVVLDPFMGSGTTLVAAKYGGRNAIGIELEERYCEMAANRLAQGTLDFEGIA